MLFDEPRLSKSASPKLLRSLRVVESFDGLRGNLVSLIDGPLTRDSDSRVVGD